jgi:hypothetical protein
MALSQDIASYKSGLYIGLAQYLRWAVERFQQLYVEQFKTSGGVTGTFWPPLSPFTTWIRTGGGGGGLAKPLMDTGELSQALVVVQTDEFHYSLTIDPINATLIRMFEYGYSVDCSPETEKGQRVRKWFATIGWPLADSTKRLVIPARPILGPIIAMINEESKSISEGIFGVGSSISLNFSMECQT